MYRALALKAIEQDISFDDEAALVKLAEESHIQLEPTLGGNRTCSTGATFPRAFASATSPRRPRACRCIHECGRGWWRGSGKWARAAAW